MSIFKKQSFFNGIRFLLVLELLAAVAGICSHNSSCHSLDMETAVLHLTAASTAHSDADAHHDESKHILDCHCVFHG
ncbi:hypothetical protein KAH55_13725, partial [bacterium]|nr:hypothetical protein [bacterium]